MKKVFLLFAVVALTLTAGTVRSNSTKIQNSFTISPGTPEEVTATFHAIMTNIMEVNFPANPNYDASNVAWDKVKQEWHANGMVNQVGGNGSVEVVFANFENNGNFIEFFYIVHND
jgi:hypothetical protein